MDYLIASSQVGSGFSKCAMEDDIKMSGQAFNDGQRWQGVNKDLKNRLEKRFIVMCSYQKLAWAA